MKEIVLDTETTGLDYDNGDRIVEIGIVELRNHVQTGNYFHYYLNPEKESDPQALKIHGLTYEFLRDKPKFSDIVDQFIDFISDSKIIIHNASFDLGFINSELTKCNKFKLDHNSIIDTLIIAKKKFPGQSVSLDTLCRKYNIDISDREIHGGLKDAKLLAQVYLELIGGKQTKLKFGNEKSLVDLNYQDLTVNLDTFYRDRQVMPQRRNFLDENDNNLHLKSLEDIPNSIWERLKS